MCARGCLSAALGLAGAPSAPVARAVSRAGSTIHHAYDAIQDLLLEGGLKTRVLCRIRRFAPLVEHDVSMHGTDAADAWSRRQPEGVPRVSLVGASDAAGVHERQLACIELHTAVARFDVAPGGVELWRSGDIELAARADQLSSTLVVTSCPMWAARGVRLAAGVEAGCAPRLRCGQTGTVANLRLAAFPRHVRTGGDPQCRTASRDKTS